MKNTIPSLFPSIESQSKKTMTDKLLGERKNYSTNKYFYERATSQFGDGAGHRAGAIRGHEHQEVRDFGACRKAIPDW